MLVRFIEELAGFARVIMLDKRGTGLSDRVREVPTLETRMDDLRAVMEDAGSERAILWTAQEGARLATLFAATSPERVAGLVLFDPSAKGRGPRTTRGRSPTPSGGTGWPRSVWAGGEQSS